MINTFILNLLSPLQTFHFVAKNVKTEVMPAEEVNSLLTPIKCLIQQINSLVSLIDCTKKEEIEREQICESLEEFLSISFPGCKVQPFGSIVSGLAFQGCDLDLNLEISQGILLFP